MLIILIVVLFFGYRLLIRENSNLSLESETIERFWTFVPMLVLISIVLPRCSLLNKEDSFWVIEPETTIKVRGFQWNWQREGQEDVFHAFDVEGLSHLYGFEEPLLTKNLMARFIVSRGDVLHSLGFPGLGVKLDAIPGRLNSFSLFSSCLGLITGSCYELCGAGHRVIPISWLVL